MTSALFLAMLLAQSTAGGQRSAAETDAAVLARGWTALGAGRTAAAAADADRVLGRRPWDHAALLLKIEAEAMTEPARGLDTYERWLGSGGEDVGLLEPVAQGVVRAIAEGPQPPLRREARRLLSSARLPLPAATAAADDPYARDAAAASGGGAALQRLEAAASDPAIGDKTSLVGTLESVGPQAAAGLISILQSGRGPAPGDAARALGRLGATQAMPALQAAMSAPDPYVRNSAAVALARLGDSAGQQAVAGMLASSVPDIRLMAAEAWNGQDGPWVSALMPLLDNQDGLIRLNAARLIAPINPDAARRTLQEAAGDTNPVVRSESLKQAALVAAAQPDIVDLPHLRAGLRDADAAVRLYAAAGILAVARHPR